MQGAWTFKGASRGISGGCAAAMLAVVTACGGGGGSGEAATGKLKVALTDAPACGFDHVYVSVEKIRIHRDSAASATDEGWFEISTGNTRVDLLALTNGALEELGETPLPAGRYTQMRLVLAPGGAGTPAHSVQPTGGTELPLALPDSLQAGVVIPVDIEVAPGGAADVVLDFDACKSVTPAGPGAYELNPLVSPLPRLGGGIEGVVASALDPAATTVSAQQDGVIVRSTRPDESGRFSIPFLRPGTYMLVVASDGRATGVVTGVPVDAAATKVGTAGNPIELPGSTMGEIAGSVSQADESGQAQDAVGPVPVEVRASQQLAQAGPIEVRSLPVDRVLGTYRISVPDAAPVTAPYAPSGSVSFATDGSDGGYRLDLMIRPPAGG